MPPFNKYAGEVPFEPVKGVVFRFTHGDLAALVTKHGPDYLQKWQQAVHTCDTNVIGDFVKRAWKGEGGSPAPKKDAYGNTIDFDDPPWPLPAVVQPVVDALNWALSGKTTAELAAETEAGA